MPAWDKFVEARASKRQYERDIESDKRATETHKANLKYQGLQGEKLTADMDTARKQREKKVRIGELTGAYLQAPDQTARGTALQDLSVLDADAAGKAQGIYGTQQTRIQGEDEEAKKAFARQFQIAQGLPDEERVQQYHSMIGMAATPDKQGKTQITEEEADQLSMIANEDPEKFEQVMENILGITPETRLPAGGVVQLFNPQTDETAAVDMTDPRGRERGLDLLEAGWLEATDKTETSEAGGFGKDKKAKRDFNALKVSTMNTIDTIDDAIGRLEANPDAFTQVADLVGLAGGIATEVEAGFAAMGMAIPASVMDLNSYSTTFEKLGIEGAQAQGVMFDLSLAYAGAIGLGEGRALTEKDVERALKRVGAGGMKTAKTRRALMQDVRKVVARNFKNTYEVWNDGEKYSGDLGGRLTGSDAKGPAVGDVVDGFEYLGGDPNSQDSWKKQ